MTTKSNVSFIMLKCWSENISMLDNTQKAQLLTAIYDYQCLGKDFVTNDGMLKMLWATVKQTFEYNDRKYQEKCQKNRLNAQARYKNNCKSSEKQASSFNISELDEIK